MQLGVCAIPEQSAAIAAAGFDFLELHVQRDLKSMADNEAFDSALNVIHSSVLPCRVANCFIPGSLKITGDNVDQEALELYVTTTLNRAYLAGIDTIVFGSGGARHIPDTFSRRTAWGQIVEFGKMVGPIAQQKNITIVVEPLNRHECNVLNSVGESGRYVMEVNHPSVRLLVDAYHWGVDNDSSDDIVTYGHQLHHVHIATVNSRLPPGLEPCDFTSFFKALKTAHYEGRISVEARWDDIDREAPIAYEALAAITSTR
jgi:sugar phosphate isomerase/epimerase